MLHAGPPAIVGGYTALEFQGLENWRRDDLTILVDDEEPLRRAPRFPVVLAEIEGGAGSLAEIDVTRM